MDENPRKRTILGYVSAYLKQAPRTLAQAERDRLTLNAPDERETEPSRDTPLKLGAPRDPANEK
jgi:hypothetical protein